MKKNISSKLIILVLLTFFGCKAKKQLVAVHKPDTLKKAADTVASVKPFIPHLSADQLAAFQAKQIGFLTFSAKAKAKLNIDGNNNDVTLNIRIKRNEEIWISVTALLGIEGARAVITPDSIKVINRLGSTYLKKPFSYIYQYAGNQVSYQALENLVIGNAWPGTVSNGATAQPNNGGYILNGMLGGLVYQLSLDAGMHLTQTVLTQNRPPRSLQVDNSGAFPVADRIIPAQINVSSQAESSKININLTYTKADFNTPVDLPFTIPARYSAIN